MALRSTQTRGTLLWRYNPVCKATSVILHGVVSPDHPTRGCIPRSARCQSMQATPLPTSETRADNLKPVQDLYLEAMAKMWPRLPCTRHVRLTAVSPSDWRHWLGCTPSGDTTPCKVTLVILHGVVSPDPHYGHPTRVCIPRWIWGYNPV